MSDAPKPLLWNAFLMNTASHIHHGQWRHPEARQSEFEDVRLWVDLARTLEEGVFDAMFFADVTGLYGPAGGQYVDNVHEGLQIPSNDPAVLLGALAVETSRIGLAYTSNVMQQHPFNFARQVSTLDHISRGRVAWNIVTSTQENAARNFGLPALVEHDARYDWADKYLEVVYQLWEGSWDGDSHLPVPSPQRTPYLFQAGGSPRGIRFAAQHAEAVFIAPPTPDVARQHVAEARAAAVAAGRHPDDVKFFPGLTFVVGENETDVARRLDTYQAWASAVGYLTHSGLGVLPDGTSLPPETLLKDIENNGGRGFVEWLRKAHPDREPTLADLAESRTRRGIVAGTPDQIADQLLAWQAAGIDGVNVINWRLPGTYVEHVERLLPTLQRRGLARREYAEGDTLRGRITGHDRLDERHPAAAYRGAFAPQVPASVEVGA